MLHEEENLNRDSMSLMQIPHEEGDLDTITLATLNEGLQRRRELSRELGTGILKFEVLE